MEKLKIPLMKGSSTYKMIIPEKVEKQIRFLCERSWSTEWSGVLFYKYTGNFEDGSLTVICEDIYPMDIGSSAYTEFNMSPDVISYMTKHLELLDCKTGLIHSHNNMATFFSGTDLATLEEEGAEKNHFVSLIVNNAGKYTAAITRKISYKQTRSFAYEGFDGTIEVEDPNTYEGINIEYFNLDITIEAETDSKMKELADRFDEIKERKEKEKFTPNTSYAGVPNFSATYSQNKAAWRADWKEPKAPAPKEYKTPSLFEFEDETQRELREWNRSFGVGPKKSKSDSEIVDSIVAQLLTGSVLATNLKKVMDNKWLDKMGTAFKQRFGDDSGAFKLWAEDFIQFLLWYSVDDDREDLDLATMILSEEVADKLRELPNQNLYIKQYIELLNNFACLA